MLFKVTILESNESSGNTRELARKYFSQISLETVKNLYSLYKIDFELFGYSPELYYGYAQSDG